MAVPHRWHTDPRLIRDLMRPARSQIISVAPQRSADYHAMMISVKKESVEKTLDDIDRGGTLAVPHNRTSTKFCLVARGRHYPPKYVLRNAYQKETGIPHVRLKPGRDSNEPLQKLGYEILEDRCGNSCNVSDK